MLTLTYTKDAKPLSDYELESWANSIINDLNSGKNLDINFCNETALYYLRAKIFKGEIDYKKVKIKFILEDGEENTLTVDENAKLSMWPEGFCCVQDRCLHILLDLN